MVFWYYDLYILDNFLVFNSFYIILVKNVTSTKKFDLLEISYSKFAHVKLD